MGIYPRGHLMEFVRPTLDAGVLPTAEGRGCRTAKGSKWPAGLRPGSTPKGRNSTVFVTIE